MALHHTTTLYYVLFNIISWAFFVALNIFGKIHFFNEYLEVPHFGSNMIIKLCEAHSLLRALALMAAHWIHLCAQPDNKHHYPEKETYSPKHYYKCQYLIEKISPSYLISLEMFYLLTLISLFFHSQFRINLSGSLKTLSILIGVALLIDQSVDN